MIILSDGLPCEVDTLPLYALDHIEPKDPGEFTYKIKTLLGEIYEQAYNLQSRLDNPPTEPEPGTDDTWKLTEWERYQAAIAHNRKRHELAEIRAGNVAREVMRRCLKPADRERVKTDDDYQAVYLAGVAQEVSEEALADSLRDFFRGEIRWAGDFSGVRVLRPARQRRPDSLPGLSGMGDRFKDTAGGKSGNLLTDTSERESAADMLNEITGLDGKSATGKEAPATQTLIASLIMYEARHGRLYHPNVRGWLFYYAALRYLEEIYTKASLLDSALKIGQARMKQIVSQAQEAEPAQRKELLKEALKLRGQMRHTEKRLRQYV